MPIQNKSSIQGHSTGSPELPRIRSRKEIRAFLLESTKIEPKFLSLVVDRIRLDESFEHWAAVSGFLIVRPASIAGVLANNLITDLPEALDWLSVHTIETKSHDEAKKLLRGLSDHGWPQSREADRTQRVESKDTAFELIDRLELVLPRVHKSVANEAERRYLLSQYLAHWALCRSASASAEGNDTLAVYSYGRAKFAEGGLHGLLLAAMNHAERKKQAVFRAAHARHASDREKARQLDTYIRLHRSRWAHLGNKWRNKAAADAARDLGMVQKTVRNKLIKRS